MPGGPLSPTPHDRLRDALDEATRATGVRVVVADAAGLPVTASTGTPEIDALAAVAALRASGDAGRAEVVAGRVKARTVPVGDATLVVGAVGDTAICGAVFDRVAPAVAETLGRA